MAEASKTSHNNKGVLFYEMDFNSLYHDNRRHLFWLHVRGNVGDFVAMDSCFFLKADDQGNFQPDVFLQVSKWRVKVFFQYEGTVNVQNCMQQNIPLNAKYGNIILEAINPKIHTIAAAGHLVPDLPVKLLIRNVHLQVMCDLTRLCFIKCPSNTCTVCYLRRAHYESFQACSSPPKSKFTALCENCLKLCFLKVSKCKTLKPPDESWIFTLERQNDVYYITSVQDKVGMLGNPFEPSGGIYALKHQTAVAQGFSSWEELYVEECLQKHVKRKQRKRI